MLIRYKYADDVVNLTELRINKIPIPEDSSPVGYYTVQQACMLKECLTLKIKAQHSFEKSTNVYHSIWQNIPED
jgi:hypothetical protein